VRDALVALPFGLAIGLLLGLVGGGGSILAVPVLVYVLGEPVKRATTESLVIVGATALVGGLAAWRAGRVRWRVGLAFAAAGAAASVGGTALNRAAGSSAILLAFGLLLPAAAYAILRGTRARPEAPGGARPPAWPRVAAAGAVTGVLTGFFGVGGGFVIVPALTLALGLPMTLAVGTSLLVIALTSAAALAAHLASGGIDIGLAAAFTAAAIAGAVAGTHLHGRLPESRLRRLFAALLVAVAAFLIAKSATALA
jgi:uncharacterized membrane protein YfcA